MGSNDDVEGAVEITTTKKKHRYHTLICDTLMLTIFMYHIVRNFSIFVDFTDDLVSSPDPPNKKRASLFIRRV